MKPVETPCAKIYMKDGIVYTDYLSKEFSLDDAKEHIRLMRTTFADQLPVRVLSRGSSPKNMSKEVRKYFANPEFNKIAKASAVVTDSNLMKAMSNLFIRFSNPTYPTKVFTNEQAALDWLKSID